MGGDTQFDEEYEEVLAKRFTVSMGMDLCRGYEDDELVDRAVDRYRKDENVMNVYDEDVDALRADLETYVEPTRRICAEMYLQRHTPRKSLLSQLLPF